MHKTFKVFCVCVDQAKPVNLQVDQKVQHG